MIAFLDILTLIISAIYGIKVYRKKASSGRLIVYFMFFFICVIPLALDYIIGLPDYTLYNTNGRYGGFIKSFNDFETRAFYDLFLLMTQFIIINCCKKKRIRIKVLKKNEFHYRNNALNGFNNNMTSFKEEVLANSMRMVCFLFAVFPVLLSLVFGAYEILFAFGWRDYHFFENITNSGWYSFAERFSYLGVTAAILLIIMKYEKKNLWTAFLRILAFVFLLMNMCIESKRSIIFFALIIALAVLLYCRNVNLKIIVIVALISASIVVIYSIFVKTTLRNYSGFEGIYSALRVDMFRDDTIKFCIYSMLHPDEIKILDFPFQSYLSQIKYFFFIDILVGKFKLFNLPGVGFNRYLSSALIGRDISAGYSYMTTSIFDEAIANFGFLGFIFAPFVCAKVSYMIDQAESLEKILLIGSIVLAMMYSPNYILLYIECTFIVGLIKKIRIGD